MVVLVLHNYLEVRHDITRHRDNRVDRTGAARPELRRGADGCGLVPARYNGRTLEAYRDDLRGFSRWAHDHDIEVMRATRPHIELFRVSMEQRGLAAATIDRRLSTVCGFYRFAHIDGIITSNPAQYVRRPQGANVV